MQLDETAETEEVVLVDKDDRQTGTAGKLAAHAQVGGQDGLFNGIDHVFLPGQPLQQKYHLCHHR